MKWFRLWHDMIDNPKIQSLSTRLFKAYINTLCIASSNDPRGTLPELQKYAFKMRVKPSEAQKILDELENFSLIFNQDSKIFIHDWDEHQKNSDNISVRVQRHREKSNVTGNVTETEDETKTPLYIDTEERREEKRQEEINPHNPRKRGKSEKPNEFDLSSVSLPEWMPAEEWAGWVSHRVEIKKPMTLRAANTTIKHLAKAMENGHDPIYLIHDAICKGYQGCVYESHLKPTTLFNSTTTGKTNGNYETKSERNQRYNQDIENFLTQSFEAQSEAFIAGECVRTE